MPFIHDELSHKQLQRAPQSSQGNGQKSITEITDMLCSRKWLLLCGVEGSDLRAAM